MKTLPHNLGLILVGLGIWWLVTWLHAATFTAGYNFTPTEQVTDVKLENLVNNATITRTSAGDTDNSTLEINANKYRVKDGGITSAKILDGTITSNDIANYSIDATDIATNAIQSFHISSNAVQNYHLATNALPGVTLKYVMVVTNEVVSSTVAIPVDGTIPQTNEGVQVFSKTFTPTSSNSTIRLSAYLQMSYGASAVKDITAAIFKDSGSNAIYAVYWSSESNGGGAANHVLLYEEATSTTNARTYNIRMGANDTTTIYLNANRTGTTAYGTTVGGSRFIIEELQSQ